jgi:HD-GYP domain-containing protein (c-di-GMP phosphodiesterase class II)
MNRSLLLLSVVLLILVGSLLPAQTIEEQTITSAFNYLAIQDYERAYSFINFVLRLNTGADLDPDVRNLAESIYFNYLKDLLDRQEYVDYETVKLNLTTFPQVNSIRIQQLIEQSETRIAYERQVQVEEAARQREVEIERQQVEEESRLRLLELQQEQVINEQLLQLKRLELDELVRRDDTLAADLEYRAEADAQGRAQQQEFNQALLAVVAADRPDTGMSTTVIIALSVVGVIVLLGFGLLALMFIRNSQQQQQFFEYTVSQTRQPREILSIPMYTAPVSDRTHLIEHRQDRKLLPAAEPDLEGLKVLMQKCRDISSQIDEKTRRKNATRNVAELVYKVSTYMGYDETECMLFLAVGMVYDIGFLEMDESIFEQTKLTAEQFESLKAHTRLGEKRIDFVPDEFKPVFRAGILKHHENLDGSGYPTGITGDEIPYIARVIRAAESYIAMTSPREFREIRNKTDASAALLQETDKYDPDILYAISSVV